MQDKERILRALMYEIELDISKTEELRERVNQLWVLKLSLEESDNDIETQRLINKANELLGG